MFRRASLFIRLALPVFAVRFASAQAEAQSESAADPGFVINVDTISRFSPRARADLVAAIVDQWQLASASSSLKPAFTTRTLFTR
jgi:hypothetical protein